MGGSATHLVSDPQALTCTFPGAVFFTRGGWQGSRTMKRCVFREAELMLLKARAWTVNSPSLEGDRAQTQTG